MELKTANICSEDRYKKYMEEHCINCKNNKTNLCEIRIIYSKDSTITKCCYYEKK